MDSSVIDLNNAVYIGIDVHRYTNTAVAANRFEEKMGELTFPNTTEGTGTFLAWAKGIAEMEIPRILGIEGSNGHGRLLRDLSIPVYREIYEVNPLFTKQRRDHGTRGDKSDPFDAGLIVEILTRKLKELPRITKRDYSEDISCLEELIVFHDDLTRSLSRLKNQLHQLFNQENPEYQKLFPSPFSRKAISYWQNIPDRKSRTEADNLKRMVIREKIRQFKRLDITRSKTDRLIKKYLSMRHEFLLTMPGVGLIIATKIVVAARGKECFRTIDHFVKYAGIAPIEKQSGKSRKHKQNKTGNRQLNNAIYTIALTQLRCHPKAKAYFQKKIAEGKTRKHALRCLMKRIACIVYGMLRTKENYRG